MNRGLLKDYLASFRAPEFWIYATWLEIITRYRRSRLGMFWALVPSALYTFGIGWFFNAVQGTPDRNFYAHLGIGYVLFRLVTVTLNDATTTCTAHSAFIMDGRVRLTDYVLRVISRALFHTVVAIPVLIIALAIAPDVNWLGFAESFLGLCITLVNLAWMGAVVAIIGARVVDIHQLVGSVLMFSFLLTPIIWRAQLVPAESLQGFFARLNPLFHFVEVVRAPLVSQPVEKATYLYLLILTFAGWALAAVVYRRYARYVPMWI